MNVILCICVIICTSSLSNADSDQYDDTDLQFPYTRRRVKRDESLAQCEKFPYGIRNNIKFKKDEFYLVDGQNGTISSYHNSSVVNITQSNQEMKNIETKEPIVQAFHTTEVVGSYWDKQYVPLHIAYVGDPAKTVSVHEPLHSGTCQKEPPTKASVLQTAQNNHCQLAVNAGFFNTTTGGCLGNIVSDGQLVQHSGGIQNVHFGILKTGALFFGYLTDIDIIADDFLQLVGGVLWVLKDGEVYIDKSIGTECRDTEATGSLYRFASVQSARTLVGHDKDGRLMILQVDGKTDHLGVSLYQAAEIMKKFGAINAINLDGGGSSTLVINNTLVNYASDTCRDNENFQCQRNVSTILCVHEPYCDPQDCGGHGSCENGECSCHGYWTGSSCDILKCLNDCSGHGDCLEDGCECFPGYHGDNCSRPCEPGWYGNQCLQICHCDNNSTCDTVSGVCQCLSGNTGKFCHLRCSYGYYGDNCTSVCSCKDPCSCDHVTGSCNYTLSGDDIMQVGHCLQEKLQNHQRLEGDMTDEFRIALVTVVVLATTTFLSVTLNLLLLWKYCAKWKHKSNKPKYRQAKAVNNGKTFIFPQQTYSSFSTSTSDDGTMETSFIKSSGKQFDTLG